MCKKYKKLITDEAPYIYFFKLSHDKIPYLVKYYRNDKDPSVFGDKELENLNKDTCAHHAYSLW